MGKSVSLENSRVIKWKVKNMFSVRKLESEAFSFNGSRWCFKLVQRCFQTKCIRIYLNKIYSNQTTPLNKFRFLVFIEDEDEKVQFPYGWSDWRPGCHVWEGDYKDLLDSEDTLLEDGFVTFSFIFSPETTSENKTETVEKSADHSSVGVEADTNVETLTVDFLQLLTEGTHSDVTLKCGDTAMPAHSCILSARSKVFTAMLRSDMAESRNGVIEIADMDSTILDQLLQFIYSGKLSNLSENTAPHLYAAGDKYDIESLKTQCSAFLQKNLTDSNACSILTLADAHSDTDLRESTITFILSTQLMKNDDIWLKFCDDHPKIAIEILNRAYKKDAV